MLIGGEVASRPAAGEWIDTPDPATGKTIGTFPGGGAADVDAAVDAARRAFRGPWRKITPYERGRLLQKVRVARSKSTRDELAQLITLDNGKPLWEAKKEVATAVSWADYYAGWATKLTGETIPLSLPGQFLNYTMREPLGVVAGITPPNYPLTMPLYKAAPALATGNTIILKPAEQTSLVALRLAELFLEAGLPEGVFNVVTGYGETAGAALADHDGVDKITFTGSTEVGRLLVHASAGNLKKVSLELGGKSPNIVFADADLDAALKGVFIGHLLLPGRDLLGRLAAVRRGVGLRRVRRRGSRRWRRACASATGWTRRRRWARSCRRSSRRRVLEYLRRRQARPAPPPLAGGKAPDGNLAGGYFVEPTVFTNVKPDHAHRAARRSSARSICAMPFKDLARRDRPRATTRPSAWPPASGRSDLRKAHQAAAALEAGTVWVNCYNAFDNASPWGGMKQSGWGREKGQYGLDLFTQVKSVIVNYT